VVNVGSHGIVVTNSFSFERNRNYGILHILFSLVFMTTTSY
jgi:hypothetical protein